MVSLSLIARHCVGNSKPYLSQFFNPNSIPWQYRSIRTLLLQSASECLKLRRLSDSDSGIVEVSLDRPATKNAIGKDMLRELQHSFEAIHRDSSANILMICSSVPKVFCAGADLKALCIPTIAVIEGAALGGGLEMALSCDLRICGEDAVLGLPETGLAIIPGAGGTQRLPRLVGRSLAKELIFTGRKVGGRDAVLMGLVNHCVPAGEAHLKALEIAREINQKGPLALRMAKRAIDEGLQADMTSALELEEDCYEELLNTKDRLEGLLAFAEKRKPKYTDVWGFQNLPWHVISVGYFFKRASSETFNIRKNSFGGYTKAVNMSNHTGMSPIVEFLSRNKFLEKPVEQLHLLPVVGNVATEIQLSERLCYLDSGAGTNLGVGHMKSKNREYADMNLNLDTVVGIKAKTASFPLRGGDDFDRRPTTTTLAVSGFKLPDTNPAPAPVSDCVDMGTPSISGESK
ncbi:ATP-dependent caseinolytic (Clp) protease/crotonase family protein [Actinidia rufa]|uniref:ATP-dependent caseinolytic (Clp) protease/crotonase family protein n=1 Tax=Actinidia rufa TaxID=165716 RepID=A0A7J0FTE8_9ERIC|nr:ATP-dependent caseinolytic (Clp) protease/crotonase family protein [Actinidia rufa]